MYFAFPSLVSFITCGLVIILNNFHMGEENQSLLRLIYLNHKAWDTSPIKTLLLLGFS